MSTFDYYAAYYDLLYRDKDYAVEVSYLLNLMERYASSPKDLLNLGCGTGKHDLLLAEKGFKVTGVDLSEKMIAKAKQNKASNERSLRFYKGDIRTFRTEHKFDVVTSLFHVINYQITNDDLLATFETAKVHLKPNGLFIFDSWYGPGVLSDIPERRIKEMEDEQISVSRLAEPTLHFQHNLVDVNYTLTIKQKESQEICEIKEQHRMRFLFYPEVELLAKTKGFDVIGFETWLNSEIPQQEWYVTFICKLK